MKLFSNGQKVQITDPYLENKSLMGRVGIVVRLKMADSGAWVNMEEDLPVDLQRFEADDSRYRHIMLYPEECTAA